MIYPDVPLHKWMAKHPGLEYVMPLCHCQDQYLRPYRTHHSAGLECTDCGASGWTGATPQDNADNLGRVNLPPEKKKPTLRIV